MRGFVARAAAGGTSGRVGACGDQVTATAADPGKQKIDDGLAVAGPSRMKVATKSLDRTLGIKMKPF